MELNAVEKVMYSVMKAISDSRIPISFKGSMVLKACVRFLTGYARNTAFPFCGVPTSMQIGEGTTGQSKTGRSPTGRF